MPSEEEKFLEEMRWAEVRIKRVKVTRIHCGTSVAPLLFSQPYTIYRGRWMKQPGGVEVVAKQKEAVGEVGVVRTHIRPPKAQLSFSLNTWKKKGS